MAAILRLTGAGGECCDCAAQVGCSCGACSLDCRAISGAGGFTCYEMQSRLCAGSGLLCGFPENAGHVSSPPIAYRRRERSGSFRFRRTGGIPGGTHSPPCPGTVIRQLFYTLARVDIFAVGACSSTLSSSSATVTDELLGVTDPGNANNIPNHPHPDLTTTIAATTRTFTGSNLCTRRFIPGQVFDTGTEEQVETLSIADTYEAAITRVAAPTCGAPSALADMVGPFAVPGVSQNPVGLDFTFSDAPQVRVYLTGLTISTAYQLTLVLQRRLLSAGPDDWEVWQALAVAHTAAATDEFTSWRTIPTSPGYEVRVASACLTQTVAEIVAAAIESESYGDPESCGEATAFITPTSAEQTFTFQVAQVRFSATGLVVGATYRATVTYGQRPVGTGGAFSFRAADEITFLADASSETSDWLQIPIEQGQEIAATICALEALS